MQLEKKSDFKVLERSYVEVRLQGRDGRLTRREAVEAVAQQLGVVPKTIGIIRLEGQAGTTDVVGKFYVYESAESKKRVHPRYLEERMLTKEEREKLQQERKKAAASAQPAEAKK